MASINRLSPILAIAVGVLHAGLAPVLAVSDVRPNIALVAVVLVTCWSTSSAGAIWAFLAGLTVSVLSGQPLGAIPLSLLAAATLVAVGRPLGATLGPAYPVAAVALGSIVADATILATILVIGGDPPDVPIQLVAIGALVNASLAVALVAAAWLLGRDRAGPDRVTRWTT